MDIECYEKLCTAIVKQGIYDYKKALERVRRYPKDENAMHMKEECERFQNCMIGMLDKILDKAKV